MPLLMLVLLVPLIFLALLPLLLIQRYRAGKARRPARPWVATENIAVLHVLADLAPSHGYLPPRSTDAGLAALQWLAFSATEVHKLCLYPMFNRQTPDAVKDWARAQLPRRLAVAARQLDDTPWLAGDAFTVADAHFGWALALCRLARVDGAKEGSLARYWDLLQSRPAFAACLNEERALYEQHA